MEKVFGDEDVDDVEVLSERMSNVGFQRGFSETYESTDTSDAFARGFGEGMVHGEKIGKVLGALRLVPDPPHQEALELYKMAARQETNAEKLEIKSKMLSENLAPPEMREVLQAAHVLKEEKKNNYLLRQNALSVKNCSFEQWYSIFNEAGANSKNFTIRSRIIELPKEFLSYLDEDGIFLPKAPEGKSLSIRDPRFQVPASEDTYEVAGDVDWEADSVEELEGSTHCFPKLEEQIEESLQDLKREAFVKLNWTSPRDSGSLWNTMKCTTPGHVYLQLKSSDLVQHDLHHAFDNCWDAGTLENQPRTMLVLRRWSNLHPWAEFRCFVVAKRLVAIVQRNARIFHDFLKEKEQDLLKAIRNLFDEACIMDKFPEKNFVLDLYVDKSNKGWIIDFGPLPDVVSSQDCIRDLSENAIRCSEEIKKAPPHELLSWDKLHDLILCEKEPEFIIVADSKEAEGTKDAISAHRVPIELVSGELTPDIFEAMQKQFEEDRRREVH